MEQTAYDRKRTLGDLVRELRSRVKIEPGFKDKLYHFLNMRNALVHNLDEVPGWDLDTKKGREFATKFLVELFTLSAEIAGVLFGPLCGAGGRGFW